MPSRFTLPVDPGSDSERRVKGYHGTLADIAARIVSQQKMHPSGNEYDWLGSGAYFWEDDPQRALEWAAEHAGGRACAVVAAEIRLGTCLNLVYTPHRNLLAESWRDLEEAYTMASRALPVNRGKRRERDCAVLNHLCDNLDKHIDSIRCVFSEGDPIYDGAGFFKEDHIQICVRSDVRSELCIGELKLYNSASVRSGATS